ncbi:MAG: GDP-mannose 4,6-dehydratase [Promethearchaeota archaeon]|jgi:GDP-4-dehydro-6-deoxy-D-mannose reductase
MDNILITGSNGFVGSHLIDFLIGTDFHLYGLDRPSSSFEKVKHYFDQIEFNKIKKQKFLGKRIKVESNKDNLFFLECDLRNASLMDKIILHLNPKYIFHFGAQPYIIPSWEDPVNTIETNVIGTITLFESIKRHNLHSRVILACTSAEFGTTASIGRPLKETDPLKALHPYGISKIAAELLSRQYFINFGIESVNLRFFNLTGTRRTGDASSDFIRKISQIELGLKKPLLEVGNLRPYRDILDVRDAISGIWLAATNGTPGETYHICSSKKIQIKEILETALNFSKKEIEVIENTPHKLRKTDEDIVIGDNSKIRNELGWNPQIPLNKTLKEMFDYWTEFYK